MERRDEDFCHPETSATRPKKLPTVGKQAAVSADGRKILRRAHALAQDDRSFESASHPLPPASSPLDWLVEQWELSLANAQAVVAHFEMQRRHSVVPRDGMMLIEHYREPGSEQLSHYFFHSLIGRGANDALSRIVAWRVARYAGGNALVTVDDYGFLLTLGRFQELPLERWRECFARAGAEEDLRLALKESELVRWQFRTVAQTGLMVPRQLPGKERKLKQLRFSAEILFRVLEQHEPDLPSLPKPTGRRSPGFWTWKGRAPGWIARRERTGAGSSSRRRWSARSPSACTPASAKRA